ncbi:MAG TPA: hypothetical protein VLU73_16005 [Methylococcaceae bacterium]|jgi:hypothetical protein|nr:hypothetical protein [Methylococcaceae bacterium]
MSTKADYTWQVTAVNGFLLIVAAMTLDGVKSHYFILDIATPIQTVAGVMIVYLLFSGVLTGVLYLASRNREQFRVRRCLIISVWALVGLQSYPLISSGKDQSNAQALNNASTLVGTKDFAKRFDNPLMQAAIKPNEHPA